ncbi:NAD(P)H-dependent FMN reductase [Actinocorallia herbida]|uniref:NAD(P)H-dependent FMN reductase n=1 Tax=Actinocorallia herbida TaxID=58109 RepID=A0A3N1CUH0_9ACTN|nr:NAD(P)H-dependent oxidoreductase [Actinocorallia herbida]ROO84959.1 NAD(P)H-dependent FMN reductase [Actinocorallia herbida]
MDQLKIAVIVGSTREGRFGPSVASWVTGRITRRGDMEAEVIDLVETPLPTVFPVLGQPPAAAGDRALLAAVSPRMAAADAFVIVTPEYNHSFPAALKNAIDWHSTEWHAKPVAFVSYGAFSGGLRAIEQLRPVLAELHAVTVRDAVSLQHPWALFDGDGKAVDPALDAAAELMLDRVGWWARALRTARTDSPYAA